MTENGLLDLLQLICKHHGSPLSKEALAAGLPFTKQMTPQLFLKACERAGLNSKIEKRPFYEIPTILLPAILILKNNQTCLLKEITEDGKMGIIFPAKPNDVIYKTIEELNKLYADYVIFVQPKPAVSKETQNTGQLFNHFRWFWTTLWHYRQTYYQVIIASLLVNIFALVSPIFVMVVYNRVIPNSAEVTLWVLSIGVFFIFFFDFLLRSLRAYLTDVVGKKADIVIGSDLFARVLNMQYSSKPASTGAFIHYFREFDNVRDFLASSTLVTIIDIPFIFLFLGLIIYLAPLLVISPLIVILIIIISSYLLEIPLQNVMIKMLTGASQKNATLMETMAGFETIKSNTAEGLIQRRWEQQSSLVAQWGLSTRLFSSLIANISMYCQQLVVLITVIIGVYLILRNDLTIGGLIACNILASRAVASVTQVANLMNKYQQTKLGLDMLTKIINLPSERPIGKPFLHLEKFDGKIELKSVNFTYPDQKIPSLQNISLEISPGERIGILGRIGSGKSTLLKLLARFYTPESGQMLLDGIDQLQYDPADIRHKVAYVPQDTVLFTGTLKDNILMGKPTATDDEILKAAKLAGVDQIANQHPLGYHLSVGERGESLSAGQRQSVSLARALLRDPKILLLDEPTSAMDEQTERELINRLVETLKDKTLIIVTHRASLMPLFDRLVVLHEGKIALSGPRDIILKQLIPQGGQK